MPPDDLNEDGASDIPLHRLPGFGTGLHRQRVAFVKAGAAEAEADTRASEGSSVADVYLSIVMGKKEVVERAEVVEQTEQQIVCEVCQLPTSSTSSSSSSTHAACLVHQVALGHSKPPSSIDRSRFGLTIMAAQGWDPDSGRGLGRDQQGMAYPLAPKARLARQALGDTRREEKKKERQKPKTKKEIRRAEDEKRRRHQRLHEQIMGRDLERYLGPGG